MPIDTPTADASASSSRWLALDVFRALAVLWMIQGHTFTALLGTPELFASGLGQLYRTMHGLTAPMFLCGAGLAYGIVTFNAAKPAAPGRLLRRALLLLAIGTCLQLPAAPALDILQRRELLLGTIQPGALQLVAACLGLAELLRSLSSGRPRVFAALAALSGACVVLTAPWVWNLSLSSRYVLGSWLDGESGAQFPLTPWLSFFLLGAAISAAWGARLWRERWRAPVLGALGLFASALCYWQFAAAGERLSWLYGAHAFWLTNPMFVVFRAGLVLAWLGTLSAASGWIARSFARWPGLARVITALSRHSLVAYVVHLSLLYGLPLQRGLSLLACSAICALVLSSSVLCVWHWERLRAWLARAVPRPPTLRSQAAPALSAQLAPRGAVPRDPLV